MKYNKENMFGLKFKPVAFFMIILGATLDLAGLILLLCGLDDLGAIDIIWAIFSTPCYLICCSRTETSTKSGPIGFIERIFTGKWSRFLTPDLGGLVPWLGNAIPFRTISAYLNTR